MSVPLPVVAVVVLLVGILAYFIASLVRRSQTDLSGIPELDADSPDRFCLETYRPMERLFDEADFEFLASQPGYDPRIARKLRTERRRIFRGYLRCLISDFNSLVRSAQLIALHSPEDNPELAGAIFRVRLAFFWNVAATETRLALAPLPLGSINPERLIGCLTTLRDNLENSQRRLS